MPLGIGQVTPSVARIKRVAAMHTGLDLGLGLGSHADQITRHGPKSVPISDGRLAIACNSKRHLLRQRISYFLKLTQPSSILAIATGRNDRAVISMSAPYSEIAWSA